MLFSTPEKCFWVIFPRCFFHHQNKASGRFWFSLVICPPPPWKKSIWLCLLVLYNLYGCHTWTVWLFAFPKTLQKSSDPCGGEMKNIICNAKQCAHAFRIKASELWVAHRGRRVSQRRRQPVSDNRPKLPTKGSRIVSLCHHFSWASS